MPKVCIPFQISNLGWSCRISSYPHASQEFFLLDVCPAFRFCLDRFYIVFGNIGLKLHRRVIISGMGGTLVAGAEDDILYTLVWLLFIPPQS